MTDYITNYYFYCKLRERTPISYWGKTHLDRTALILRYIYVVYLHLFAATAVRTMRLPPDPTAMRME